jgi:hypothetical protein
MCHVAGDAAELIAPRRGARKLARGKPRKRRDPWLPATNRILVAGFSRVQPVADKRGLKPATTCLTASGLFEVLFP